MIFTTHIFVITLLSLLLLGQLPAVRRSARMQNALLLLGSYAFYIGTDARMALLLLVATAASYALALEVERLLRRDRLRAASWLTTLGVTAAVGLLLVFKYLDFFAQSVAGLLSALGLQADWTTLNLVLPLGLSFYTFKLISYIVEVHRERLAAERDFVKFAAYVAFFPTIAAGPIDRPAPFLAQLSQPRTLTGQKVVSALRMILWGMFMKVCIADLLSPATDQLWAHIDQRRAADLWMGFLLYPIQMYADFSGYSAMAIGTGRLLGLSVAQNFNRPFLARNVAEYWRRWHMSLTSWITDYVFMPLNLRWRDYGKAGMCCAIVVNLVVIGLWHGDSWTYALFGLYHGLLFVPLVVSGSFMRRSRLTATEGGLPKGADLRKMLQTYLLVGIGFLIFRAPDLATLCHYAESLFQTSAFAMPHMDGYRYGYLLFIVAALAMEWVRRNEECALDFRGNGLMKHRWARWAAYYIMLLSIYLCSGGAQTDFIYTQF